jgi:hypothetical protein
VKITVANETVATTLKSARPARLLMSPRSRKIENVGTINTSLGMISGASTSVNSNARRGGRRFVSE